MSFCFKLPLDAYATRQRLRQQVLGVNPNTFDALALAVFRYQAQYNALYQTYLHQLAIRPAQVAAVEQIPFLPIGFFKHHTITTGELTAPPPLAFASSGTTQTTQVSRHLVADPDLYDAVSLRIFEDTYGSLRQMPILALLPSYLERNNSSLVYMVQRFMAHSGAKESGFFLDNYTDLTARLHELAEQKPQRTALLIGVTFGLLDWLDHTPDVLGFLHQYPNLMVMETGGMKGRQKELLREEVHARLMERLGVAAIHSEYGMTELLSQAYSVGDGVFGPGATMRVLLRDVNDPFHIYTYRQTGERRTGGINVIDLANLDSCAFIETQDLGQYVGDDGRFRVMGRIDNSDLRGCNLLVA